MTEEEEYQIRAVLRPYFESFREIDRQPNLLTLIEQVAECHLRFIQTPELYGLANHTSQNISIVFFLMYDEVLVPR